MLVSDNIYNNFYFRLDLPPQVLYNTESMAKDFRHQTIRERKDRKENPHIPLEQDLPLENDYSEESNADSVCWDNSAGHF